MNQIICWWSIIIHYSCITHEVVKYSGCNYYVTFICFLNIHLNSESFFLGYCNSSCSTSESLEIYHSCNGHVGSMMITENSDFCWVFT